MSYRTTLIAGSDPLYIDGEALHYLGALDTYPTFTFLGKVFCPKYGEVFSLDHGIKARVEKGSRAKTKITIYLDAPSSVIFKKKL